MLKLISSVALLVSIATTASAVSYQTIINLTPSGCCGTSSDPADGNQIVIDWDTFLTGGLVDETDLTGLTFSLYGTGGLIFSDTAIASSAVQPIGGVARALSDLDFFFDLDIAPGGDVAGLVAFDNDFDVVQEFAATGVTYNMFGLGSFAGQDVFVDRYVDGDYDQAKSIVSFAPVPLPPAGLAAMAGLGALVGLRRSRRKT